MHCRSISSDHCVFTFFNASFIFLHEYSCLFCSYNWELMQFMIMISRLPSSLQVSLHV